MSKSLGRSERARLNRNTAAAVGRVLFDADYNYQRREWRYIDAASYLMFAALAMMLSGIVLRDVNQGEISVWLICTSLALVVISAALCILIFRRGRRR